MPVKLWLIKAMLMVFAASVAYGGELPADEREFMTEIQTLRCGIRAGGEVWPGYGLGVTPIVVYLKKSGLTVLFSDSGPLPGFKPADEALLRYGCGKHEDPGLYFKAGRFSAMERQFTWKDIGGRQVDPERRAAAGLRFHFDPAAMLFDNAKDRGQPQSSPFADFFGGEKGLENVRQDLRGDAAPGVADA